MTLGRIEKRQKKNNPDAELLPSPITAKKGRPRNKWTATSSFRPMAHINNVLFSELFIVRLRKARG